MSSAKKVLVIGATGNQGGGAARGLLALGDAFEVYCLVRDVEAPKAVALQEGGAKLIQGSMLDKAAVAQALQESQATQLYFMTNDSAPRWNEEVDHGKLIIDAAKENGVEFVVFSSVAGCDTEEGHAVPFFHTKFLIEEYLKESGLGYGILRPVSFFENFDEAKFQNPLTKGKLGSMMLPTTRTMYVSTEDIGKAAAQMCLRPEEFNGVTLDCAACEATGDELVAGLSKASGVPCRYVVNPSRWLFYLLSIVDVKLAAIRKMVLWLDRESLPMDKARFLEVVPDAAASPEAFFSRLGHWHDGEAFTPASD